MNGGLVVEVHLARGQITKVDEVKRKNFIKKRGKNREPIPTNFSEGVNKNAVQGGCRD